MPDAVSPTRSARSTRPQPSVGGPRELEQHAVVGDGQTMIGKQLRIQLAHGVRVRSKQRPECFGPKRLLAQYLTRHVLLRYSCLRTQ